MQIANQILRHLESTLKAAGNRVVPTIKALHLPPSPWNKTKDGEFAAIELSDGSMGLSYVLLDDTLTSLVSRRDDDRQSLPGQDALSVAHWWTEHTDVRRTIGFAAANALSRHLFDRAGFVPKPAGNSIGEINPQPSDHIGMVGLFPPLLRQVTASGATLTVLELREELAGEFGNYQVTTDPRALAQCNKVLTTSTVLLNDTLDQVLTHCRDAQVLAMIGPGAGCLPDVLFEHGVTVIGGAWITKPEPFSRAVRTGAPWADCTRKFVLHRRNYRGIETILSQKFED